MNYQPNNSADIWIRGCIDWMTERAESGWDLYYLNIMFRPLIGSLPTIVAQMHDGMRAGFYARFCTEFVRNPRAKSQQDQLPQLWLIPDRPRFRRVKTLTMQIPPRNDNGLHFNGPMAIPPKSRFRGCPIEHIEENQSRYARNGIERIHVKPIDYIPGIGDYAFKTIKSGRADPDDILILPASPSELPQKTPSCVSSFDRGIKDIQAALNVSDGVAEEIYARRNSRGFEMQYQEL